MESTSRTGNNNQTPSEEIWSDINALIGTQQQSAVIQGNVQAVPQASFAHVPHNHLLHTVSLPAMTTTQPIQPTPTPPLQNEQATTSSRNRSANNGSRSRKPFLRITEQPTSKGLRFRYVCEGRTAGSIPGVNSTADNKTFPTIEIVGYKGEVTLVVSCVTKDKPHKPHPHKLVVSSKDGQGGSCKKGVFSVSFNQDPPRYIISNVGIQCTKKSDIRAALQEREECQTDPFKTGFSHMDQPSSIDLNVVRLCFQAFIKVEGRYQPLDPVVSDAIFERKAHNELTITRLCSCVSKMKGNSLIIMLCDKVTKEDIKIKFYETNEDGTIVWSDLAEFQQTDVHKQTAIAFKTPPYAGPNRSGNVTVQVQLYRPSDGATSEPRPFEYHQDPDDLKRKRLHKANESMNKISRDLQQLGQLQNPITYRDVSPHNLIQPPSNVGMVGSSPNFTFDIKAEDTYRDIDTHSNTSASPFGNMHNTFVPSPASYSTDSTMPDMQQLPQQNMDHYFDLKTITSSIAETSLLPTNGGSIMQIPQIQTDQNNDINMELYKFEQQAQQYQNLHQQQSFQPINISSTATGSATLFQEPQTSSMTSPTFAFIGAQPLQQSNLINQQPQQQQEYIINNLQQHQQEQQQSFQQPQFQLMQNDTLTDLDDLKDLKDLLSQI